MRFSRTIISLTPASSFLQKQYKKFLARSSCCFFSFFFTVSLGLFARWFFFHYLVRLWETMLAKIPFISSVYKTCQDIIYTLFASSSNSFKQVVMAPFPSPDTRAIGFVTNENIPAIKGEDVLVAVFVPTTPNPTSGFLMIFKEKDLTYLDMKVEDALKYVISCGVVSAELKVKNNPSSENPPIPPLEG